MGSSWAEVGINLLLPCFFIDSIHIPGPIVTTVLIHLKSTGYSWFSNQRGLGIDNLISFELVLPTGEVVNVDKDNYPDLWFAVRGGGNNFVRGTIDRDPIYSS